MRRHFAGPEFCEFQFEVFGFGRAYYIEQSISPASGGSQLKNKLLLDRRAFIRAGSATIALPLLEAMFPSSVAAAGAADPKRYVCFYIASGTYIRTNNGAFWYPAA